MESEHMNVELSRGGDSTSTLRQIRDLGHEGWRHVSTFTQSDKDGADKIFVSLVREAPRSLPV